MATLILKATERCNSNCSYCDVVRKPGTGASLSPELLEVVLTRVDEYLRARPDEQVELLWHGGEPLLLGPDYFRTAAQLQRERCPQTQARIRHSIQTNLTLFSDEFATVFRQLGIGAVGTSYDPIPGTRGPGATPDSSGYNAKFMAALALLERRGFSWGMIYVVTRRSLEHPLELFHFLTNLQPGGEVNLNQVLIYDEARQELAITPEEFSDFLGEIFPTWWAHRERWPGIQPFKELVGSVAEGQIRLGCVESGACSYHHVNVAPDGETSQCGRSADWGLLPYGNIVDRSLDEILHDEQRDQLHERVEVLAEGECEGCRFWQICHGGCPLDAWSKHRDFMHKSEWCEARRRFIREHLEPVTGARFVPRS